MIIDFAGISGHSGFHADICIIGAGAAGITLARALKNNGQDILLIESGGRDYEDRIQNLADGHNRGFDYYDLKDSRLRFFGGTTAIWGGRVAQLDDIDFERRDWVPGSGWPFGKDVLRPYYRQAQALLGLDQVDDNGCPAYEEQPDLHNVCTAFWQFDEMFDRFTLARCEDLARADNIRILLHANAVELETSGNGKIVQRACIKNLCGGQSTVTARHFVLAAGGLEVPRLLLASQNSAHPRGIGNMHDQVGRCFMEHPHARGAHIEVNDPVKLFHLLPRFLRYKGARYGLLLRPSAAFQKREGVLNSGFTLAVRKHEGQKQVAYKALYNAMRHEFSPTRFGRGLWKLTRRAAVTVQDRFGPQLNAAKMKKNGFGLYAVMRAEQAPNPDSRVVLSDERDEIGMKKIALDWRFSALDKDSVGKIMAGFDRDLRACGLGRAVPAPWLEDESAVWHIDPLVSNHPIGGYHHMGTARMAADPKRGVVDENGKVHDTENLYIAGSAVFPTGGWANPTLTILALALRLGEYLKR